jgi:hypothetical protein
MGNMTMGQLFTPQQLARFRKYDELRCKKQHHPHRLHDNGHVYSYLLGYIRCTKCLKWIHPDNPEDVKQYVRISKSGRRMHKDCPVGGMGGAQFTSRPRHRRTREKRRDAVKRY